MQVLSLIFLFLIQAFQPYHFKRYDTSSGLSSNIIHDVYQDSEGYLWVATENGLNRFDGHEFRIFKHLPADSTSLSHNVVLAILEDNDSTLWIGTWNGLNKYDRRTNSFQRFPIIPGTGSYRISYNNIVKDHRGHFWFPGPVGVTRFDPRNHDFQIYSLDADSSDQFRMTGELQIFRTKDEHIWIYNNKTFFLGKYDRDTDAIVPVHSPEAQPLHYSFNSQKVWARNPATGRTPFLFPALPFKADRLDSDIEQILEDEKGNLWVGTSEGLLLWNGAELIDISSSQLGAGSLNQYVEQLTMDRWGSIWVGTRNGLYQYNPLKKPFYNLPISTSAQDGEDFSNIAMTLEAKENGIWIGTLGSGLFFFDEQTEKITHVNVSDPDDAEANQLWDVFIHPRYERFLWIATTSGLYRYDKVQRTSIRIPSPEPSSTSNNITFAIIEAGPASIWVSGDSFVYEFDIQNNEILNEIRFTPGIYVSTVQDLHLRGDSLFISTQGGGLLLYDHRLQTFLSLSKDNSASILYDFPVWDIHPGKEDNLWLATGNGLYEFNYLTQELTHHSDVGPGSSVFFSVIDDTSGRLWIGADKGLIRFDPDKGESHFFDQDYGIANLEFNRRAILRTEDGQIWMGGTNGLTYFHPGSIRKNPNPPIPKITGIDVFDGETLEAKKHSGSQRAELRWTENTFDIHFSAINFTYPEKVSYTYRMQGLDPSWIPAGDQRIARYISIDPGSYTFEVQATNGDGVVSAEPARLDLYIAPPFWKTNTAYLIYLFVIAGAFAGFIQYRTRSLQQERKKLERMVEERTKELESQKELALQAKRKIEIQAGQLKELDDMKSRFFANISHELRTPLTLIDAPLQQLLSGRIDRYPSEKLESKLKGVWKNSRRLGKLIDELLDLSRLKEKAIEVKPSLVDLHSWFTLFQDSYQSLAFSKGVTLSTHFNVGKFRYVLLDQEKFDKITSNLINNALKFTGPEGYIEVTLSAEQHSLIFEVLDSGPGIPAGDLPHIFDRFYKAGNQNGYQDGLGLGLALSQELAQIMNGNIRVESTPGEGSRFSLHLPVVPAEQKAPDPEEPVQQAVQGGTDIALIVEDNDEMRKFLVQLLQEHFEVYEATDGADALKKLKTIKPVLILTDLMMPEMDGLEFTHRLRSTPNFSSIPILMLTARASDEDRLYSLRMGVDDYLSKPFIPEEVLVRSLNLARNFKVRSSAVPDRTENQEPSGIDLLTIENVVLDNMDDHSFSVAKLSGFLHISERQCYRMLQRLTGMTPLEYINTLRLSKARTLLINNKQLTIEQVSEKVGFRSRSHFSRLFKKAYGLSPSVYQARR